MFVAWLLPGFKSQEALQPAGSLMPACTTIGFVVVLWPPGRENFGVWQLDNCLRYISFIAASQIPSGLMDI